jgi:hypothetical protein
MKNKLTTKSTKGTKRREVQPWFFVVSFASFVANSISLQWPPSADFTDFPDSMPI